MKRERFYQIIANPNSANEEDVAEIERLSGKFPWFPAGHALTALLDHLQNAPEKGNSLKIAAAYSGNRNVLFDQLNRQKLRETILAFEKAIATEEIEPENRDVKEEIEVIQETLQENSQPDFETYDSLESIDSEAQSENNSATFDEEESDELATEILMEAVAVMIENEVSKAPDSRISNELEVSDQSVNEFDLAERDGFAAWLKTRSGSIGYDLKDDQKINKVNPTEIPEKKSISDLIDDFIKNEPKITPGKAEEYANKVHGANALVEDENFVTETLAAIYARQGKLAKAKKAYRLLSLKYPEKSVYFAAQIKKLDRGEL